MPTNEIPTAHTTRGEKTKDALHEEAEQLRQRLRGPLSAHDWSAVFQRLAEVESAIINAADANLPEWKRGHLAARANPTLPTPRTRVVNGD